MRRSERDDSERVAIEEELSAEELLETLVAGQSARSETVAASGPIIGLLAAIHGLDGSPLVTFPGQIGSAAVAARSVIGLGPEHVGRDVLLLFEQDDRHRPIVIGVLQDRAAGSAIATSHLEADGERLVVAARDRLTLRCGKASITLTKEGKILIEGAYVATSAAGVNRIKGGSVQIN